MAEVRAELDLSIEAALAAINEIEAALDSAVNAVEITADVSSAESEIASLEAEPIDVPVDADVSSAEAAIAEIDGDTPQVSIEVDDSAVAEASAAVDELGSSVDAAGSSASGASGSMGGFESAAAGAGAASALARGNLEGATSAFSGIGSAAGGAAAPLAAAAAGFGIVLAAGEKMHAGIQRVELVFGEFRDKIENIDVGGLTGQLGELAVKAGVSGAEMRQAAAQIGQFAQAGGQSKEASAGLVQQLEAIALRAVAMNPALGSAGDVMNTLVRAVQRGGPALAKLGLNFNQAQVAAEAARLGLVQVGEALTPLDKLMAGTSLATQQLGNHLGSDFARGSEQTAVKLKSLEAAFKAVIASIGAPLIDPFVAVAQGASAVLAPLELLSSLVRLIPPDVIELGVAFAAFRLIAPVLETVAVGFAGMTASAASAAASLPLIGGAMQGVATASVAAGTGIQTFLARVGPGAIAGAAAALLVLPGILEDIGVESNAAAVATGALSGALIGGLPGALIGGALGGIAGALGLMGGSAEDAAASTKKLAAAVKELSSEQAAAEFLKTLSVNFLAAKEPLNILGNSITDVAKKIKALGEESPAAAHRLVDGLLQTGVIGQQQFDILSRAATQGGVAMQEHARNAKAASDADAALGGAAAGAGAAMSGAALGANELNSALGVITVTAPTIQGAFDAATASAQKFGGEGAVSIDGFVNELNASLTSIQAFPQTLQTIVSQGFPTVAAFIASQGPELGAKTAQAFAFATPAARQAMEDLLIAVQAGGALLPGAVQQALSGVPQAVQDGLTPLQTATLTALDGMFGAISGVQPQVTGAASTAVSGAPGAVTTGLAPVAGAAGAAASQAVTAFNGAFAGLGATLGNAVSGIITTFQFAGAGAGAALATSIVGSVATGVSAAAAQITTSLSGAVSSAASAAAGSATAKGTPVGKALDDGVASGVTQGGSKVTESAKTVVQNAAQGAESAARSGGDRIGRALSSGMADGVASAASQVNSAVVSAVNSAIQRGIDAANAKSPSHETRDKIGIPLAQGIAVGIDQAAPDALDAMDALVAGVIDTVGSLAVDIPKSFEASVRAEIDSSGLGRAIATAMTTLNGDSPGVQIIMVRDPSDAVRQLPITAQSEAAFFLDGRQAV